MECELEYNTMIVISECPTNCQDCTVSSGKAQCKSGKCDVGFGRSGNKEACTGNDHSVQFLS